MSQSIYRIAASLLGASVLAAWAAPATAEPNTVQWLQRQFQGGVALCKAQSAQAMRKLKLQNVKTEQLQVSGESRNILIVSVCNDLPTGTIQTLIISGKNEREVQQLANSMQQALPK